MGCVSTWVMHELRDFLLRVLEAKRLLKRVYYSTKNKGTKDDAKQLVIATISAEKTVNELIKARSKHKMADKILSDRKAELSLKMWTTGLPKRVKDYMEKENKLEPEHLHQYQESLLGYIEGIAKELTSWLLDIETLSELPHPPHE